MALFLPLLASAGSAYLQYRGQKKQLERDEARNQELLSKNRAEQERRQRQIEGSFGVDKYSLEALEQARSREGIKQAEDQANLSAANQMELAARLGGRGGLSAASIERQRQQGVAAAGQQQRLDERRALQDVGAKKANLETLRRDYRMGRMTAAEKTAAAAQQNLFNAQDSQQALKTNLYTGLLDAAMPLLGTIGGGGGVGAASNPLTASGGDPFYGANDPNFIGPMPPPGFINENGGKIRGGKKGMKTPGEFSHSSNPINLMQNGSKVGEVTGGEYVVNPEQARKIAQQSAYARMLFKKFDKEA
jgi:hypothetical protein